MKKLFFCLLISLSTFGQKQIPYGSNPKAGHYASIRGIQIYYEIYGKGELLLFIHGNNGSIQDSLSYEQMADDFASLLDYLKLDSVNVVGWSDGGINGLLLASRHPKKVRKLAVTGANLTPEPVKSTDARVVENEYHVIDSLSRLPVNAESKRQLKLHRLLVNEPHISRAELNKIHCPTLVIGGDHDVIMPRHT